MNAESAGMAEYFQYLGSRRELGRSQPILPLIAKPSGLLSPFDIDEKLCRPFVDLNCVGPLPRRNPRSSGNPSSCRLLASFRR